MLPETRIHVTLTDEAGGGAQRAALRCVRALRKRLRWQRPA
jgi:hypothetical protein